MEEINSDKIKKAKIAVGIPSLNETDSISYIAKQADAGLQKYFKNKKAAISTLATTLSTRPTEFFCPSKQKLRRFIFQPRAILGEICGFLPEAG